MRHRRELLFTGVSYVVVLPALRVVNGGVAGSTCGSWRPGRSSQMTSLVSCVSSGVPPRCIGALGCACAGRGCAVAGAGPTPPHIWRSSFAPADEWHLVRMSPKLSAAMAAFRPYLKPAHRADQQTRRSGSRCRAGAHWAAGGYHQHVIQLAVLRNVHRWSSLSIRHTTGAQGDRLQCVRGSATSWFRHDLAVVEGTE